MGKLLNNELDHKGRNMKKAVLTIIFVVLGVFVIFVSAIISKKSLTIEKGYETHNFKRDSLVYNLWSYGNWREHWEGRLHISTYDPPYTLVLAISDSTNEIRSIKILEAKLCKSGICQEIGSRLDSKIENVMKRDAAPIQSPYAAFAFKDAIPIAEDYDLFIEFSDNKGRKHQTAIKIVPFEKKKEGIYICDVLMGV